MKNNFAKRKYPGQRLFLCLSILVLGLSNCRGPSFPAKVHRENLTLEEAQALVTFPICKPAYLPSEINSQPQINYDADSPDIPELAWIRLIYKRSDSNERVLEVSQRFTINANVSTEYPDVQSKKLVMLWWISPRLSVSKITRIAERVEIQATSFQTNETWWWLYEITEPTEYQSTLSWWIKNQTEFQISSFLSVEEIKKITQSMLECVR